MFIIKYVSQRSIRKLNVQHNELKSKSVKHNTIIVATLALGSPPRQGLMKVRAKYEAQESHFMISKVQKNVRE